MRLRDLRALACSALFYLLAAAIADGKAGAQVCPSDRFCFYVPPGLPLEASHSSAPSRSFDIVLSSPVRAVSASYSIAGGAAVPITISPGESRRIPLAGASGPASAYGVAEQRGVFLIADSPNLTVDHRETFDQEQYSETIKHSAIALGTRFRLAGYSLNGENRPLAGVDAALIYAPTAATVTIVAPPAASLPFWFGSTTDTYSASLQAGQTLAVRTVVGRDIDGALLTASAPVAVSAGGRGWSQDGCGDDGMDGLVPTGALGREHVVRLPGGSIANGESSVRVIGDIDGTEVRVNGALQTTLAAGSVYEFVASDLSYVQTSQPALVWMNGSLDGCELDTVLIPPIAFAPALTELSLDFNVLASDRTPAAQLAILIAQNQVSSIRIDGATPAPTSMEVVPGRADLVYVRFSVAPGDHNARAGADFQAMLASRTQPSGLLAYYNPYRIPGCGDGALDVGEGCDDENLRDGDGCSGSCRVEPGYACQGAPSICATLCGDGVLTAPSESCDDGNNSAGDGCNTTCRRELSIAMPAADSALRIATPVVSGSADPGAAITWVSGNVSGGTTVNAQGDWSFVPAEPLAEGMVTILVTASDVRGGVSMATRSVLIDSLTSIAISEPVEGALLPHSAPTLRGTGEPRASVEVSIDGASVGVTGVRDDGTWEFTPTSSLAEGARSVRVSASDALGNVATAGPRSFVVDTTTQVTISEPTAGATLTTATPVLSGSAEAGASVEISVDGSVIAVLTADAEGNFSTSLSEPLPEGAHSATARTQDAAGNQATFSVDFRSDTRSGPTLLIHNPPDGGYTSDPNLLFSGAADPGAQVIVSVDGVTLDTLTASFRGGWSLSLFAPLGAGGHSVRAESTDARGRTAVDEHRFTFDPMTTSIRIVAPRQAGVLASASPEVSGTSAPRARVELWLDDRPAGEARADGGGSWTFAAPVALGQGAHTLRASASDGSRHAGDAEVGFYVDTETRVQIRMPAAGAVVGSSRPTLVGSGEALAIATVAIDGVDVGEVDLQIDGSWTFVPSSALAPGPHVVVVRAVDQLGNEARAEHGFVHDPGATDDDGDGRPNREECSNTPCPDSDGDGLSDEHDEDDDGDGLPTAHECSAEPCRDSDADGRPDYLDPDDDDDARPTQEEHGDDGRLRDTDYDGVVDQLDRDDDGDGADTSLECAASPCPDSDEDGRPDWLDPDDDNDGLPSARERSDGARLADEDVDADGIVNWLDADANGNGVDDGTDGSGDDDGDGVPNYLDRDLEVSFDPATNPLEPSYTTAGGGGCSTARTTAERGSWLMWLLWLGAAGTRRMRRRAPSSRTFG